MVLRRLPIRVLQPCHEAWAGMTPRGPGRHCTACDKTVVDLTRVTRREAESIVRAHGGELCGRLAVDARGEPVFRPEPLRLAPLAFVGALAACSTDPSPPPPPAPVARAPDPHEGPAAPPDLRRFGGSVATGTMMPISAMPPVPPPPVVLQVPSGQDEPVSPTPEQRRLTRRKQLARTPHVPTHTLGVIRCPMDP